MFLSSHGILSSSFEEVIPFSNTKSLEFDGSLDYVSVNHDNSLSFGDSVNDSPFSISAWIKPSSSNFVVLSKNSGANDEYLFYIDSSNKLNFILSDNSGSVRRGRKTSSISSLYNSWIHVVATYDGAGGSNANNGIDIYINNVLSDNANNNNGSCDIIYWVAS